MTSNVANEEIASHALKLRREAEVAKQHRGAKGVEMKIFHFYNIYFGRSS